QRSRLGPTEVGGWLIRADGRHHTKVVGICLGSGPPEGRFGNSVSWNHCNWQPVPLRSNTQRPGDSRVGNILLFLPAPLAGFCCPPVPRSESATDLRPFSVGLRSKPGVANWRYHRANLSP